MDIGDAGHFIEYSYSLHSFESFYKILPTNVRVYNCRDLRLTFHHLHRCQIVETY